MTTMASNQIPPFMNERSSTAFSKHHMAAWRSPPMHPPSHHVFVVLVGEVKSRQDGLELVENLIVFGHVGGQNTSAGRREEEEEEREDGRLWRSGTECVLRGSGGQTHLMIPSLMRLYSSADRFLKMLL